jgi:putative phosphoesterase
MKVAIISDIHGNFDALSSFSENYDELWVLGDLVNYGPEPGEVIDYVRNKASIVLRGNHDQAVGYGEDPRCVPPFRELAAETQKITESLLNDEQRAYLRTLPTSLRFMRDRTSFFLCHATPANPLYGYIESRSSGWIEASAAVDVDFLLAGHTHVQFIRRIGDHVVANPGSLGQSASGGSEGRYAVWENGILSARSLPYPVERTVHKVRSLPLPCGVQAKLIRLFREGAIS